MALSPVVIARKADPTASISDAEWRMRVDLAACYRLIAHYDMDDMFATHISARVPGGEDHFLLNPYGVLFEQITASSLVKVDLDGNIVQDTEHTINPAGFVIHSAVHAARHDAQCVIHTHTVAGMAVACMEEGLLPLTQKSMRFYNRIAYHDYEGVADDLDERERLVRRPRQAQRPDPAQSRALDLRQERGGGFLHDAQPRKELQNPDRRHVDRRQAHQALAQPDGARRRPVR